MATSTKRRREVSTEEKTETKEEKKFKVPGTGVLYYCANPLLGPRCRRLPAKLRERIPTNVSLFETLAACEKSCLSPAQKEKFTLPEELQLQVKKFLPVGQSAELKKSHLRLEEMMPALIEESKVDDEIFRLFEKGDFKSIGELWKQGRGLDTVNEILQEINITDDIGWLSHLILDNPQIRDSLDFDGSSNLFENILLSIDIAFTAEMEAKENKIETIKNYLSLAQKMIELKLLPPENFLKIIFDTFLQTLSLESFTPSKLQEETEIISRELPVEEVKIFSLLASLVDAQYPGTLKNRMVQKEIYHIILRLLCLGINPNSAILAFFESLDLLPALRSKLELAKAYKEEIKRRIRSFRDYTEDENGELSEEVAEVLFDRIWDVSKQCQRDYSFLG